MPTKKLKVINLFGAPAVGKTATRAGIFWLMKANHFNVHEISEFAQKAILSGNTWQLKEEQTYLFAQQHHEQLLAERAGFEYAVTDSPLHLSAFYAPETNYRRLGGLIEEAHERFENINYFLTRPERARLGQFDSIARAHDYQESLALEVAMRNFLEQKNIPYTELPVDINTPWRVVEVLGGRAVSRPTILPA